MTGFKQGEKRKLTTKYVKAKGLNKPAPLGGESVESSVNGCVLTIQTNVTCA